MGILMITNTVMFILKVLVNICRAEITMNKLKKGMLKKEGVKTLGLRSFGRLWIGCM